MSQQKISDDFRAMLDVAHRLAEHNDADAVLVMLEGPTDWEQLRLAVGNYKLLVAADDAVDLQGATEAGIDAEVQAFYVGVFDKVYKSAEWQEYLNKKGLIPGWLTGQALTDYFIAEREAHRALLKAAGEIK